MGKTEIHIVHSVAAPGGIESLMPGLIQGMSGFSFRIFILKRSDPGAGNVYAGKNMAVRYGSRSNVTAFLSLWLYALRRRNDIFHAFNIGPYFLLALRLAGVKKLVYSVRGTKYFKKKTDRFLKPVFWRLSLSKHVRITANSEYSRSVFMENITGQHPVTVLYNPIYGSRISPHEISVKSGSCTVVYAGRLAKGKNLKVWIEIAIALRRAFPEMMFEIYGNGPQRNELEDLIVSQNAAGFIRLKGFSSNIQEVYERADLLLFLSEFESFGNVAVECILCGTPVIASAIPSMQEIFRTFPDFLVALDDQLEQAVMAKILQIDHLKTLAVSAREEFKDRFSLHRHIQELEGIYGSF